MTGAVAILICCIAAFAAALGWFAARLTAEGEADGQRPVTSALNAAGDRISQIESGRKARASSGKAKNKAARFVAVIKFPSFQRFRQVAGEEAADAALADYARRLCDGDVDCKVHRTGTDTIECELSAGSDNEAVKHLTHQLSRLRKAGSDGTAEHPMNARAGLVEVHDLPAPQSAFDTAERAVMGEKSLDTRVVVARSAKASGTAQSAENTIRDLLAALQSGRTSLVYQPKLDVRTQSFRTAEALFRWQSTEGCQLNIGELIVLAEQYGAIEELTLWALRRAVSDQLELIDHGIELKTFVNLSGNLVSDSEFTLKAIDILKDASGRIGLEITETSVIEHAGHALANLELYSAAGAEIAIDDYGTGLSSLRYLKRIPAQELKIDREFVKDLTNSHRDPMIVRSTIDLAHALGMKVTAEGVDCPTKLALLKVMGSDQLQGFHIAKPMPLTDLIAFINDSEAQLTRVNSKPSLLPTTSSRAG